MDHGNDEFNVPPGPATVRKPSFEVASLKPGDPAQDGMVVSPPGGRLVVKAMPLSALIAFAYEVRDFQIIGGPGWMRTDPWDIEARTGEPSEATQPDPNSPDPLAVRLQSLLEDRFSLRIQRDTREVPIYELSIAKSGLRMKLAANESPLEQRGRGARGEVASSPQSEPPRFGLRTGRGA